MFAALKKAVLRLGRWVGGAIRSAIDPMRSARGLARDSVRTRAEVVAENAMLRQQVIVLQRKVGRPPWTRFDRLVMVILARFNSAWGDALHIAQPATLRRWHRDVFTIIWKRKSKPQGQPNRLNGETIKLIQKMATSNRTWGAERIRGELLKLGISKRSIQKYIRLVRPPGKQGQTWGTFLKNHTNDTWACDFLQLYDALFRPIFAFFIVKHGTREVVHFAVTRSPSDAWAAQQLREATPWGEGPEYLIRDNDSKFGSHFDAVANGSGIEVVTIPPRSPNLNPIVERFLGSVRRECLDHMLIVSEVHLYRVLKEYVEFYFNPARPHQGLEQRIPRPVSKPTSANTDAEIIEAPVLNGLHHVYEWAA